MNIDKVLVLSLFGGFTAKLLIMGSNPSDAAVVLILAAAHFLYNSQIQNKDISKLNQEVKELKTLISEQNKTIDDVRSAMSSIKISQGLRPAK